MKYMEKLLHANLDACVADGWYHDGILCTAGTRTADHDNRDNGRWPEAPEGTAHHAEIKEAVDLRQRTDIHFWPKMFA